MGDRGASSGKGAGGAGYKEVTDDSIFDSSVNKWKSGMNYDEKDTVSAYTGDLYYSLNAALRAGDTAGYEDEIKNLDSALSKFTLKDNIVTYRGTSNKIFMGATSIEEINASMIGAVITDKAYMSSSVSKSIADNFEKGFILKINVPKGKGRGAYVRSLSNYKSEKEFLIARGSKFRIDKADYSMGGNPTVHVTML